MHFGVHFNLMHLRLSLKRQSRVWNEYRARKQNNTMVSKVPTVLVFNIHIKLKSRNFFFDYLVVIRTCKYIFKNNTNNISNWQLFQSFRTGLNHLTILPWAWLLSLLFCTFLSPCVHGLSDSESGGTFCNFWPFSALEKIINNWRQHWTNDFFALQNVRYWKKKQFKLF